MQLTNKVLHAFAQISTQICILCNGGSLMLERNITLFKCLFIYLLINLFIYLLVRLFFIYLIFLITY